VWLGLDVCGATLALLLGVAVLGLAIRRRASGRAPLLRGASWMVAVLAAGVPVVAFASGPGPLHGRDTLPATTAVLIEDGIQGALDAPDGRYEVVSHPGTAVTAHLSAGGEAFDARFGDITGAWQGSPHALGHSMQAAFSVSAASIDTGVGERTKHAREGYLQAARFPRIEVALERALAVRASGPHEVAFRAPGTMTLLGRSQRIEITGTLSKLDEAARGRLGLTGDVLLVQADVALSIADTALAPKAHDFDDDRISIHVSLVLRRSAP
jgi:polyisoprenoid-binding protein YceI